MARIRTVKPEFFQHEEMSGLTPHARLLAIALLQLADRFGRLRWVPMAIHAHAFPYEPTVSVEALACELESIRYLVRWQAIGKSWAWVLAFQRHQVITGTESKNQIRTPEPPENINDSAWHANGNPKDADWQSGKKEKGRRKKEEGSLVGTVPVPSVDVGPDDTRTIPASPPLQEPIPALRPGPAVKADPVLDVWAGWRDCNPTARTAPTAKQRTAIKARLTEHTAADLGAYFRWVRESPHPRATYCRENGHDGFESVMRPGHVDERMGWVKAWLAGEDQRQRAKGAAAIANYTAEAYTPDDDADPMGYGQRVVIDCDRSEHPPVEACPNCGLDLPVEWSAAFGWWRRETCCEVGA